MRSRFHLQEPVQPSIPGVFFYLRQNLGLPLLDGGLISLKRSPLWTLTTPAHPVKDVPNCTRVTPNFKQLPDDLSDPIKRPIVSKVSICRSAKL